MILSAQTDNELLKTKISLSQNEANIQSILEEITNKYSIAFSYDPAEIDVTKKVKLSNKLLDLNNLLIEMFRNTGITYKVYAKVVILKLEKEPITKKKKITISGIIKDSESFETLVGSTVYSINNKTGEITNQYGFYSITIPEGDNKIRFSYIGYEPTEIDTFLQNDTRLDVVLKPTNVSLFEVIITYRQNKISDFKQGFSRIEMESVKALPSLFGETDVIKNVLLLPDVNSTAEFGGGMQVRGGSWDQNLMLLDDAVVYNSNHLFGIYSTYNPDIIKDLKFYKDGIPASYGGRASSVMDVTLKEGNLKTYHIDCGLGLISGRIAIEAPIIEDKSSFVFAARRSLFEPYMRFINNDNAQNVRPYFYDIDINAKINYILNPNNRLYLSFYSGYDNINIINSQDLNYGNITTTLRYNHIYNDRLFSNISLIFSNYKMFINTERNSSQDTVAWTANLGLEHYEFKNDYTYTLQKHKIKFGYQSIFYIFHPGEENVTAWTKLSASKSKR